MAVESVKKSFIDHYGVGKKHAGKPMSKTELEAFFEKARKPIVFDEFVPAKNVKKLSINADFKRAVDVINEVKPPTLLTRLKRIPSVLVNILKHIK